ncbi:MULTISPECIES: PucR family transcriptional regulator [Kitasatospora]|uniref:Helix-turn-helix domain-containing protein n=1 Tax=Kitasatospora arboriphila TaxID=258052 RepID=A0ABN1TMF2_9ACTN
MSRPAPPPEIVEVAATLLPHHREIGERLARRMRAEIESYRNEDLIPFHTIRASCIRNIELMIRHFVHTGPADLGPPQATGRMRAEQGVPLPETLHAYRIGFEFLWAELVDEARRHPAVTDAMLVDLAAQVWQLAGEYSDAVARAYRETTAALVLQRERERSALVEALLTGAISEIGPVEEAGRTLGLASHGPYAVIAADVPAPGREALPGIENALRAVRVRSAWRLLPDQQIGVASLPDPDDEETLLRLLRRHPARVGVSPSYPSLRDTPQALRFARLALDGLRGKPRGTVRFDDRPLAMLVAAAPAEAARLARLVLGPLLELPREERERLTDTLEQWFAAAGSTEGAAERLYVHANTVRYRLRRIEALTGRTLQDPRHLADIGSALLALRLLPGEAAGG